MDIGTIENGKIVGEYNIVLTPTGRTNVNSTNRNIGINFNWSITVKTHDPLSPLALVTPWLEGFDGLPTKPIRAFTINPNGPSTGYYATTITPDISTRNTQVSRFNFDVSYGTGVYVFGTDHTLIRCDNAREVSYGTGCVNVYFTPIMNFWSSEFPNVTHNITLGQATTGAGLLPNNPLTRATPEQAVANRNFSCSPARIAALLPPKPDPSYQCDEYPFASSVQGGTENTRIMWVPGEEENRAHGEQVQSYQRVNRLMAGDYFFVRVL